MRIDARYMSPLFENILIFLDDTLIHDVRTADEEAGTVQRFLRDAAGHLYFDSDTREAAIETVRGKVRVVLKPTASAEGRRWIESNREQEKARRGETGQGTPSFSSSSVIQHTRVYSSLGPILGNRLPLELAESASARGRKK